MKINHGELKRRYTRKNAHFPELGTEAQCPKKLQWRNLRNKIENVPQTKEQQKTSFKGKTLPGSNGARLLS